MTDRLRGKIAFITGGASGIGRASARLFAREGARVVICDINAEAGRQVTGEIRRDGGDAFFLQTDVTDEQAVLDAFRWVDEQVGAVNILYNCAGGSTGEDTTVDRLGMGTLDHVLALELRSAVLCAGQAIPQMIAVGGGAVINMASFVAFRGVFGIHAYTAAKGALVSLTRAMAGSYAKQGIRVNAIAPGIALSERAAARITESNIADTLTFDWKDYPFATGAPEDIAHLALFLASDESRMVSGQTIAADGGLSAY